MRLPARAGRVFAAAALGISAAAGGTACSGGIDSNPDWELTVVSTWWTGWDPNYVPSPETTVLDVTVGESVEVRGLGDDVTIAIAGIGQSSVAFETSEPMRVYDPDSNTTMDFVSRFEVSLGETIEFEIPSEDGGVSYEVTLSERP